MRNIIRNISFAAVGLLGVFGAACTMDTPFGETEKGTGILSLTTDIKGETVTRAGIDAEEMGALRKNAIVYIERKATGRHEVIRKYNGLETIPGQIALAKGQTYLAEGWTGDSVSASFSSKFYRGKTEEFRVEETSSVVLKMNIANVLVAFAPETFDMELTDLTMTVKHSRGELTFTEKGEGGSTLHSTGYFMMPSTDKSLSYVVTGKTADGIDITREGVIENVERAHQYLVRLKSSSAPQFGGGMIKIEIEDIPVIEEEVAIFGRPFIEGVEFDLAEQVVATPGTFSEKMVYVCGYGQIKTLTIGGEKAPEVIRNLSNQDIVNNSQEETAELEAIGIHYNHTSELDPASGKDLDKYTIYFSKEFLDALPENSEEYVIDIFVEASVRGENNAVIKKSNSAKLRIANTEDAIAVKDPVVSNPVPDKVSSPMAVLATSAALSGALVIEEDVEDYGICYREAGMSQWITVSAKTGAVATRAPKKDFTVTIKDLKPGTKYEYTVYADDFIGSDIKTIETEAMFEIPGSSFEEWSTYSAKTMLGNKNVTLPWSVGDKEASFWGSGNEGAATANMTLTNKSGDMKNSGSYSARLESKSAMGMLAAGNIFVGTYVKTDVTDGVLSLGREYNGSHPSGLSVWVNYRPGSGVSVKGGNESFVPDGFAGGKDHGQIYVALSTEPIEVRTKASNRKLFDVNDPAVLAYGQVTLTDNFGPDGELQKVEIPIEYNDRAKKQAPKYLIIVCSASKYGDYFSGSAGSVFYLDDFELVY